MVEDNRHGCRSYQIFETRDDGGSRVELYVPTPLAKTCHGLLEALTGDRGVGDAARLEIQADATNARTMPLVACPRRIADRPLVRKR